MPEHKPKNKSQDRDYYPALLNAGAGKAWFTVLLLALIGAAVGYFSGVLLPPVYEAEAIVSMNMELVPDTNITEIMVDAEINHIGDLAWHPEVLSAVFAAQPGLNEARMRRDGQVERQLMNTIIRFRSATGEEAAAVANAWANALFERIVQAYPFALKVSEAKATLQAIQNCQTKPENANLPFCQALDAGQTEILTKAAQAEIEANFTQSLGLTKDLNPGSVIPAQSPALPVRNLRGDLTLAGAVAGLAVGVVLVESRQKKAWHG